MTAEVYQLAPDMRWVLWLVVSLVVLGLALFFVGVARLAYRAPLRPSASSEHGGMAGFVDFLGNATLKVERILILSRFGLAMISIVGLTVIMPLVSRPVAGYRNSLLAVSGNSLLLCHIAEKPRFPPHSRRIAQELTMPDNAGLR